MAFAQVQSSSSISGNGNLSIPMAATAQNNLVIVSIRVAGSDTVSSVTDNVGNTYVLGSRVDSTNFGVYQAYGVQVVGGATSLTVNCVGTSNHRGGATEYSGGQTSNASVFDISASNTGSSTPTSVSLSPSSVGGLVVASIAGDSFNTWTPETGYTVYNGQSTPMMSQYKLNGTLSEGGSASNPGVGEWAEIATSFIPITPFPQGRSFAAINGA